MNTTRTEYPIDLAARLDGKRGKRGLCSARSMCGTVAAAAVCAGLLLTAPAAYAIDGCKVLLCLAGNWRSIGACVGEMRQALRDLARGKAWPTCDFAGATTVVDRPPLPPFERIVTGTTQYALNGNSCPEFYKQWIWHTVSYEGQTGHWEYRCFFAGVLDVYIERQLWVTVYWAVDGSTIDAWSTSGLDALGMSGQLVGYDLNLANWIKAGRPPSGPPPTPSGFTVVRPPMAG